MFEKPKYEYRRNKIVAAFIAFHFGFIGLHKFYLRRTKEGLLYLLFSWTCVPLILSWWDTYWLLLCDDKYFDAKYNVIYGASKNKHSM